ncbi:MAG: DUF58 domain-containing protein [Actinomycetota bacterium]
MSRTSPPPSRSSPRTLRSVPVPTGLAAVAVAFVSIPLALGRVDDWRMFGVALGGVALLLVIDTLAAPSPRRVEVERHLPGSLTLGESSTVNWVVRNRSDRTMRVTVADSVWPSLGASRRASQFVLAGRRQHRFGATIRPRRRGRFPFGAITVRTVGPLRLMWRHQTRMVHDSLAVLPAHPSRDELASRLRIPLETGLRSVRTRGTGTDFDQLREYRPGDDIRRVDWAATARQQKAIVREYRAERNQHVIALLDNGRVMSGMVAGAPRVEHAMDAVLGLTSVARRLGDNVGLVTFDRQVRAIVPPANGASQFGRVAEAMYLLDGQYDESAYQSAFTAAASRFRRRSLFVVFTDLVETVADDALLPALRTLTRTHLVVVAAVRDPDVAAWAAAEPVGPAGPAAVLAPGRADLANVARDAQVDVTTAYRSAAAVSALDARDRTAAALSATGAIVIDAAPGRLAVDVVDRYLELKARGRL